MNHIVKYSNAFFDALEITKDTEAPVLPASTDNLTLPLPKDLERIAREIHALYNEKQQERHPERPPRYPEYDLLPEVLKSSNLRQAKAVFEKLRLMGYSVGALSEVKNPVTVIPKEYVEALVEKEHEAWVAERLSNGWTLSPNQEVNSEKKTTPYLVPYAELTEEIKQLDRDPVENIPRLLATIGLAIINREQ